MDEAIQEYRDAIGGDLGELYAEEPPRRRLRGIYRTSRHNLSLDAAGELWDCLLPLRRVLATLAVPQAQAAYDETQLSCALDVEQRLRLLGCYGSFGIAQKLVNLYMKDQWALGRVNGYEDHLHAPLDRIVLNWIPGRRSIAPTWNAWTKVNAEDRNAEAVQEYLRLQRFIREEAAALAMPAIRLEQQVWHERRR